MRFAARRLLGILSAGAVVLRRLRGEDHEPLIALLSDADVMKWALEDRPFTRSEAAAFIETNFAADGNHFGMHVVSTDFDRPAIGFVTLRECTLLGECDVEFGWVLAKQHHGRGYATALGRALIDHTLDTLRRNRVLAACNPLNTASEHILRDKLEMQFEREVEPRAGFRRRVYRASHRTV